MRRHVLHLIFDFSPAAPRPARGFAGPPSCESGVKTPWNTDWGGLSCTHVSDKFMKLLKELFLDELADMYDAEHRIVKALPLLARGATCPRLKDALLAHLKQTEGHVTTLEQVFALFDETPGRKTCRATVGMLKDAGQLAADFRGSPAINAALISAVQRVEHYAVAAYGCLREWAGLLQNPEAAGLLKTILDEEEAANDILMALGRYSSNHEALHGTDQSAAAAAAIKAESLREDLASALV